MADNVAEHEVVLRFWSKAAKQRFLGQLSDGWGEDALEFEWPWQAGVALADATHLEVLSFADPGEEGTLAEGYIDDRWHAPGMREE